MADEVGLPPGWKFAEEKAPVQTGLPAGWKFADEAPSLLERAKGLIPSSVKEAASAFGNRAMETIQSALHGEPVGTPVAPQGHAVTIPQELWKRPLSEQKQWFLEHQPTLGSDIKALFPQGDTFPQRFGSGLESGLELLLQGRGIGNFGKPRVPAERVGAVPEGVHPARYKGLVTPHPDSIIKSLADVDPNLIEHGTIGGETLPKPEDLRTAAATLGERMKSPSGGVDPRLLIPLTAAGLGAAGGAAAGGEDHPIAGGVGGGLLGLELGLLGTSARGPANFANGLRKASMLSGLATLKKAGTDIGAHLTGAVEKASLAPLKELFNVPENLKNYGEGLLNPESYRTAMGEGPGATELIMRNISAITKATRESLTRAGFSPAETDRLMLMKKQLPYFSGPVGRFILPFQQVMMNIGKEGVNSLNELMGENPGNVKDLGELRRRRLLTLASMPAGAAVGATVGGAENPALAALLASPLIAMAGPRILPAGISAATATGNPRLGLAPGLSVPEITTGNPLTSLGAEPALLRLLKKLAGE